MRSKHHSILWRVEIAERGYAGSSEEMTFAGDEPIIITWEARGDEFYAPVKASEATINILCKDNFHYLSLFTSDARQFRVSIFFLAHSIGVALSLLTSIPKPSLRHRTPLPLRLSMASTSWKATSSKT